jgi:hypothetical protein
MLQIVTPAKTFVIPAYRDIDESLTASKLDGTERISVEEKAKDFLVKLFDFLAHKNQLMGPVRKKWEASSQKVIIFESQVQKLLDHGDLYLWPSFGKDWIHQTPKATAEQLELGLKNKKLKSKLQFMMRLHLEPEHVDEGELTPDEVNNTLTSMYEDIEAAYSIVVDTPGDEKPYVCHTTATESQTGHTGNTTESQNSHTDKSTTAVTPSATKKKSGNGSETPTIENKPALDYQSPLASESQENPYLFSEKPTEEESHCLQVHLPKLRVRLIMYGKDRLNLVSTPPFSVLLAINDEITDSKLDGTEEIVIKQGAAMFLLEEAHRLLFKRSAEEVPELIKRLRLKWKGSDKQEFFDKSVHSAIFNTKRPTLLRGIKKDGETNWRPYAPQRDEKIEQLERQDFGKKLQHLVWIVRRGQWTKEEAPYLDFRIKVDFRKVGAPSGSEHAAKTLAAMVEDVDSESVALKWKQIKKVAEMEANPKKWLK